MKNLDKFIPISTLLILVLSVFFVSCDGGGGGGGGGGGQPSGQSTTIRGNVESVVAMAPRIEQQSVLAKIKDFFALSKSANAQDNNQIVITFFVNGEEADSVTVDPDGDFEGEVPISASGNNVTLVFESDGDEESVVIFVPPVNAVILVVIVNFQDNEAEVMTTEFEGPLNCEDTTISLVAQGQDQQIVINGNGGPCVLAGNCNLSFEAENVIFEDCGGCFDARGNSVLEVSADEDITCDSPSECLIARGTSDINLSAGDEINLSCIDARGDSVVILDAFSCMIGDISMAGNATVDTSACDNLGI